MSENSWGGGDDCHVPSLGPRGPYLDLYHDAFMTFIALTMYMNASSLEMSFLAARPMFPFFFFFPCAIYFSIRKRKVHEKGVKK